MLIAEVGKHNKTYIGKQGPPLTGPLSCLNKVEMDMTNPISHEKLLSLCHGDA
jgi:hypothetical protein